MRMLNYNMILWFFGFSFFGYILECIVLSYENKKLVFNRGFVHGPFCVIYGFGALFAYKLLYPVSGNAFLLYFSSMFMATMMEVVTATAMLHLFGAFWWNYSKKPFNYKGMICLESSLAWGLLGIIFFRFLNGYMHLMVGRIPVHMERQIALTLVAYYIVDFFYCLRKEKRNSLDEDEIIGRFKALS